MTSQGSPYGRFRRYPGSSRPCPRAIRFAALELPNGIALDDALEICLVLLERSPELYSRAAARWVSRLVLERSLDVADAQLLLAALMALTNPESARAGAEALAELAQSQGIRRAERILEQWLARDA